MHPAFKGALVAMIAALGAGCATTQSAAPPRRRAATAEANRVKLAVLPVESDLWPRASRELNRQLRDVHVSGIDDYFLSKVTLEVVQLSIECVEPSPTCYAAVGKSLTAQRLLIAQLQPGKGTPHHPHVHLTITLFDVEAGQAVNVVDRYFKNESETVAGISALLDEATRPSTGGGARASK